MREKKSPEDVYALLNKKINQVGEAAMKDYIEKHPEILADLGLTVSDGQLCAVYEDGGKE